MKPLLQIGDEIREMTDEEYADFQAMHPAPLNPAEEPAPEE